ncbi:MAG TPA: hypothetical protein VHC94_01705 [Nitrobacter sp.]|nr:hypothetical protein [Nitrobacter sp.]
MTVLANDTTACPGRRAARSDAPLIRSRYEHRLWNGPGSAVQRESAAPRPGHERGDTDG